jgi:hypothetical protein
VGLITRHDLLEHKIEHIAHQHEEAAAMAEAEEAAEADAEASAAPPLPLPAGNASAKKNSRNKAITRKASGASIVSGASFRFGGFPASPFLVEQGREETLSVGSSVSMVRARFRPLVAVFLRRNMHDVACARTLPGGSLCTPTSCLSLECYSLCSFVLKFTVFNCGRADTLRRW